MHERSYVMNDVNTHLRKRTDARLDTYGGPHGTRWDLIRAPLCRCQFSPTEHYLTSRYIHVETTDAFCSVSSVKMCMYISFFHAKTIHFTAYTAKIRTPDTMMRERAPKFWHDLTQAIKISRLWFHTKFSVLCRTILCRKQKITKKYISRDGPKGLVRRICPSPKKLCIFCIFVNYI